MSTDNEQTALELEEHEGSLDDNLNKIADDLDLRPRHRMFADEWLTGAATGKRFNMVAAYEHAGYSVDNNNPSANASKLYRHPKVSAYIERAMQAYAMDAREVLLRYTETARFEPGTVVTKDPMGGHLKHDVEEVLKNKKFIKNFSYDSNGNPKVEFQDPMTALLQITRILGMAKDGLELSGPGGAPIAMKVQFVDPDGSEMNLGPTNENDEEHEDFSEFDED